MPRFALRYLTAFLLCFMPWGAAPATSVAAESPSLDTPEAVIRVLIRANAEKDLSTLSAYMAHDADIVSYTIGGRKYVGWDKFFADMKEEFDATSKIEIPITELKVWSRGETAWFTMEVDYIRYVGSGAEQTQTILPLRETGVLERRNGRWMLLSWHESFRTMTAVTSAPSNVRPIHTAGTGSTNGAGVTDLSGEWEVIELVGKEEDKRYRATLDRNGNGPYTQQGGRFTTTAFSDRHWEGTWHQPGNDREGGFELLLSEDGAQAEGIWWYSRVGTRTGIPPKAHGGNYLWKRLNGPGSTKLAQ